jgi:hypothetical protein
MKLFPCLIKYKAIIFFFVEWRYTNTKIHSLNSTPDEVSNVHVPISTPGKKALVLAPTG